MINKKNIFILLFISIFFLNYKIQANNLDNKLPIPRFASIRSNKVNSRKGPNKDSAIEWVFVKKGEPVEIVNEYEQWREIKDITGLCGWVHVSVLSGKRSVIIIGNDHVMLKKSNLVNSVTTARLLPEVRCELIKCSKSHCKIKCNNSVGWVEKKEVWGVYDNEEF